jgi:hypothetical protein
MPISRIKKITRSLNHIPKRKEGDTSRFAIMSNGRSSGDSLTLSDGNFGYESFERQIHDVDRVLRKCISVLRVSLKKKVLIYCIDDKVRAFDCLGISR